MSTESLILPCRTLHPNHEPQPYSTLQCHPTPYPRHKPPITRGVAVRCHSNHTGPRRGRHPAPPGRIAPRHTDTACPQPPSYNAGNGGCVGGCPHRAGEMEDPHHHHTRTQCREKNFASSHTQNCDTDVPHPYTHTALRGNATSCICYAMLHCHKHTTQ